MSRLSRKRRLMGNHQRSWIWGRHAVQEALRSGRWLPVDLYADAQTDGAALDELRDLCAARDITLHLEAADRLTKLCDHRDHQGLVARMPEYPYLTVPELMEACGPDPLLLVLDGLQDAFNFGACLRCAEVFGVAGVIVGSRNQCGVTSHVVRSSAGAVHHVPLAQADDLTASLRDLQGRGVQVVGASEKASALLPDEPLTGPVVIVMGNEGSGIAPERLALCDRLVQIPQAGHVGSLNAAVAAGILLYEAVRQRGAGRPAGG